MPCRISTGVHERNNVVPTVPVRNSVNPQAGEQSGVAQWEEKTPWSFTAACCCGFELDTECSRERRCRNLGYGGAILEYRLSFLRSLTAFARRTSAGGQFGWGGSL